MPGLDPPHRLHYPTLREHMGGVRAVGLCCAPGLDEIVLRLYSADALTVLRYHGWMAVSYYNL